MFKIDFLPGERIVRSRLTGFWTEAIALQYKEALGKEMDKVRSRCPRFCMLSDTREFPVQPAPVMKILASIPTSSIVEGTRKLAILVSTSLNQLQAQRSFHSDGIRVFRDEEEAIAWLTESPQRQSNVNQTPLGA